MKQGNLKSKAGTLLLVAAIIITSFPAFCPEVHAAELSEPSRFATAKQLRAFNTDDSDGSSNSTKLCFGKDNQEWWIAGSQGEGSLTLFAASPLARQSFEDDYESDKPYSADWGCHYPGEAPSEVYPNHYGASPLRTTLKGLETSYFSTAEQNLMKNTTIYTKDTKKDSVYSTSDKLYLANSVSDQSKYITVGANASDDLNNGLRIDPAYWINSMYWECDGFWLRTPHMNKEYREVVLLADTDHVSNCMTEGNITGLVPAFELNLSSVLFASAAKAASSDAVEVGTIADDAAMALRLNDADKVIGTLKCNDAAGLISARKDENAEGAVSLVVQGDDGDKEWYYSVPAGEATSVTKKQIQDACNISAEIDFGKCKIWLETAVDNVAYARMAERQITITAGDQSVMWGNGIDQSAYAVSSGLIAGDRISEITLTPSGAELTDNGAITVSGVKIVNAEGEDVTGSYDIALARGSLKVIHNTNLAPDRIEASKAKTAYTAGESLNVDDLAVTAYYADGYSGAVTGFATNASDIDMSVAGDRILTVSYTENGDTKTADIAIKVSAAPHAHEFGTDWKSDSDDHWHECACGEKRDVSAHAVDSGSVTREPTETETGVIVYKCSVCGCVMHIEEIGKLPPTPTETPEQTEKPTPTEAPEQTEKPTPTETPEQTEKPIPTEATKQPQETITSEEMKKNSAKLDSGIFVNWKGNALVLKWTKIAGAEGYDIFVAHKKSLAKTVTNGKASVSLTKIAGKKISGKEVYSVWIKAWKYVDGKKRYIGSSRTYYIVGKTNKKYTNAKKLKLAKKKYSLKKGKSVRIKETIVKQAIKKKLLPKYYGSALQYWSGDKKIATVTQEGRIKAKKKGSCYIYVTALNGVRTKIKITVK